MLETIARYVPKRSEMPLIKPVEQSVEPDHVTPRTLEGVFNPERIMSFVRGKPAREREIIGMIERIVQENLGPVEDGRILLQEERMEEAARHFHTLKGSMGNFGAERVMKAAQALEQAIKQNQTDSCGELLSEFQKALAEMVQVADTWLRHYRSGNQAGKQSGNETKAAFVMDQASFGKALDKLRDRLSNSNIEAVELFADLNSELTQRLGSEKVAALADAMEDLRFADAVAVLDELQAS